VRSQRIGKHLKVSRGQFKKAIRGEKMKYECKLASNVKEDRKSFFQYMKGKRQVLYSESGGGVECTACGGS